jgi:glycosyltransferase involved in cell wall biosynthesis
MKYTYIKKLLKTIGLYKSATILYDWINFNCNYFRILVKIRFKNKDADVFFFFPFCNTGGAEWVHLQIVKSIKGNKIVFFVADHTNQHYLNDFQEVATCYRLKPFLSNSYYLKKLRKLIILKLNKRSNAKAFGCNNKFFYDILPLLKDNVKKVDLTHAFTHPDEFGFEKYSLDYVNFLDKRVVISEKLKNDFIRQYDNANIDLSLYSKFSVTQNMVGIKCDIMPEKSSECFNIVYVGRNSEEKRIPLIGKIATKLKRVSSKINVILIGPDLETAVLSENHDDCIFKGHVTDQNILKREYEKAHCVIIASSREGFPMTIMEGMMCGCVPVSTNVGGIPEHVKHNVNGVLVSNDSDELLTDFVKEIAEIYANKLKFKQLSVNSFEYAHEQFNSETFSEKYREILE